MAKQALILTDGKTLIDWSEDHDYSQDGPEIYRPADHTIITDAFTSLPSDWKDYTWVWNADITEFDKTQDYCNCMVKELTISVTGPSNDVDIGGVNVLILDTSSNSVTIGGFKNGKKGQMLFVIQKTAINSAKLEHNEAGNTQKIFLRGNGPDSTLTDYGGWTLYCDGSNWYDISN